MKSIFRINTLLLVLLFPFSVFLKPVERLDIYDFADNHLMFIKFEYDNNGNNISRSIYMSDSTFVRKIISDGNKEFSLNFNNDTILTSSYNKSNSSTELSVKDQFKLDMLGGPVNYNEKSSDNFEVKQNGSVINNISYETNSDGEYSRINILNSSGDIQFYATINNTPNSILPKSRHNVSAPSFSMKSNKINLRFRLSRPSLIDCELISLSGRRIAKLVSKKASKGNQNEIIQLAEKVPALSSGVYFITLSINGKRILNEKILMQNSGRGF